MSRVAQGNKRSSHHFTQVDDAFSYCYCWLTASWSFLGFFCLISLFFLLQAFDPSVLKGYKQGNLELGKAACFGKDSLVYISDHI